MKMLDENSDLSIKCFIIERNVNQADGYLKTD